jgi:septal ring factor EnvC (AmiA/AmiB activator)
VDGAAANPVARASADLPADDAAVTFRNLKGRLPLPVTGRSEIRRVRRPGGSGPGLELIAPPGTAVRAVFPGRVAFADRYDTFGSVVIVDHGDHFYTLLGDLASMDVRVGDDLSAGARIGTIGPASVLYFEIRKGASTLDPAPWLGL